ncbi:MAG: SPFH/Band 7/PHB domain protein [Candidatus Parvarchaeota archaeon]|nr:SPFH/Band 7/PHB domain protein [Candidatus Parvarchaeota archaeon]MCW1295570.1 SPFH/Band 7/PHB domain protein [Candidatus Parvarchaeum tengchongense]MCW1299505.1 SPFH/Band 7/PHB domain protein [Candidatus Parvarchaeum tengchongense]MCW1312210.1 SPFH/Band 7/PHB domain protein [Candidatus Parvarchaeum tengchongense]
MSPGEFWVFVVGIIALVALFLLSIFIPSLFYAFILIFIVLLAVIFFITFVKKYSQFERGIIFRLGKFNRIAGPGWAIVVPFFEEEYKKVDVRVKMMDITSSDIFTADDLKISLDGTIYYQIVDPEKATLQIDNYGQGLSNLVQSAVRNAIASLTMRQVFGSLDRLNDILADAIRHMTWKWGIDVPSVQLRSVSPSNEVIQAMQQPEIAANLLQAQRFKAEAQKIVMEAIGEGSKALDDRSIVYLYLQALKQIGESSSSKIVLPMQFMQSAGSMLGGMAGLSTTALASLGGQENVQNVIDKIKEKISQSNS